MYGAWLLFFVSTNKRHHHHHHRPFIVLTETKTKTDCQYLQQQIVNIYNKKPTRHGDNQMKAANLTAQIVAGARAAQSIDDRQVEYDVVEVSSLLQLFRQLKRSRATSPTSSARC
jgi:hypothetical protein